LSNQKAVQSQIESEIWERKELLRRHDLSKTFVGRALNVLGYFLCFYCCVKIVMATINVIFNRRRTIDPVSRIIGVIVIYLYPFFAEESLDVQFWSQTISFVFVGMIMSGSVRRILLHTVAVTHQLKNTHGQAPNNIILFISQVQITFDIISFYSLFILFLFSFYSLFIPFLFSFYSLFILFLFSFYSLFILFLFSFYSLLFSFYSLFILFLFSFYSLFILFLFSFYSLSIPNSGFCIIFCFFSSLNEDESPT
jgi:hypothetical protein